MEPVLDLVFCIHSSQSKFVLMFPRGTENGFLSLISMAKGRGGVCERERVRESMHVCMHACAFFFQLVLSTLSLRFYQLKQKSMEVKGRRLMSSAVT